MNEKMKDIIDVAKMIGRVEYLYEIETEKGWEEVWDTKLNSLTPLLNRLIDQYEDSRKEDK